MLYNFDSVNALISELTSYEKRIQDERNTAQNAATKLLANAWQSGSDGGASMAFKQKHDTLIRGMDDLLVTLRKGRDNVQAALDKAKATDQHVADDFMW